MVNHNFSFPNKRGAMCCAIAPYLLCYFIGFLIPAFGMADNIEDTAEFSLLKGQDVEVCEAYLQRLNQTEFERPPYCDRPEVKNMEGFETLGRIYLSAEEILKVYDRIMSFESTGNQMYSEDIRMKSYLYPDKERSLKSIERELRLRRLKVWRYEPMLNIDNDGELENVVMWYTKHESGTCGTSVRFPVPSIRVYVFKADMSMIDEKKTREVFEHPDMGWPDIPGATAFRFIDQVFGVFKYKNITFFDAFPGKGFIKSPEKNEVDLRVYKRQNQKTDIVCEYHWNGRK